MKEIKKKALAIAFAVVFVFTCIYVGIGVIYFSDPQRQVYDLKAQEDSIKNSVVDTVVADNNKNTDVNGKDLDPRFLTNIDFAKLTGINHRATRWLTIPNSPIDFVVIQEDTSSSDTFLNADIYGNYNDIGMAVTPSLPDKRESATLPIYAHRVYNANVELGFTALTRLYKDGGVAKDYNYAYLYHGDEVVRYKFLMSADVLKDNPIYEMPYEIGSTDYANLLTNTKKLARFDTGVNATRDEDILILSTCEGAHHGNQRFIAIFVKDVAYDKGANEITYERGV